MVRFAATAQNSKNKIVREDRALMYGYKSRWSQDYIPQTVVNTSKNESLFLNYKRKFEKAKGLEKY
jgi:hypothetical protein